MLEGVVHQLLLGYLGRYVKDFSKDQVKVTLWSIEVELSNIELILEAFDYLQLPFALREGRVGKLRIKIPWKTLGGGESIIISLEDVFFHVSTWDDNEWTADAVDKRELAGRKAKLAAAELAKLSTRVSDNGGGRSFISYITGKVLENIQVFIRNFHVLFCDMKSDLDQLGFGLRFSSLTISKQSSARLRKGQVSKGIEIQAFEIYCSRKRSTSNSAGMNGAEDHISEFHSRSRSDEFRYLLEPLTVSMSLVVNKAERLNNELPQYSVTSKLPAFVMSLTEVQLRHILLLSDYLCTTQLRAKYGRYRPKGSSALKRGNDWQKRWWLYAQNSILSDVRMKLKKTSFRWLGERLNNRRKYVELYKAKLEFLLQDQPIHESVFQELEKMEKDHDADDILSYRSAAESEMQDILSISSKSKMPVAKFSKDAPSSNKSRGWLNWLSRGMLGAGGTDDFSQFSGVVTDEDIQDIYEATNFDPHALLADKSDCKSKISTLAVEFVVHKISLALYSMKTSQEIAKFNLHGAAMECKLHNDSATMFASVSSAEIVCPYEGKVILSLPESRSERNGKTDKPMYKVQVEVSPTEVELSVHVTFESVQVSCEPSFLLDLSEFVSVYQSVESHHERVLLSLNGIEDAKSRLAAKVRYAQSSNKKLTWDVNISNIIINFPFGDAVQEQNAMVLEFGFHISSLKPDLGQHGSNASECLVLESLSNAPLISDLLVGFQIQDLYDYFELSVCDFELRLMMSSQRTCIIDKFTSSATYAHCLIPYESILKQFEVYICLSSLRVNFSPEIYESFMAMIAHLNFVGLRYEPVISKNATSGALSAQPVASASNFSVNATLNSASLLIDLANNRQNSSAMILFLKELDIWYSHQEVDRCWLSSKGLEINFYQSRDDGNPLVICSCQTDHASNRTDWHDLVPELDNPCERDTVESEFSEASFSLHYEFDQAACSCHRCTVCLNQADVHVYPFIVGLMSVFCNRICSHGHFDEASSDSVLGAKFQRSAPEFEFQKFGFSNFSEAGNTEDTGIAINCFPFVSICNLGPLSSIKSSLRYTDHDWRKFFNLRDQKIRNPRCSLTQKLEVFSSQSRKAACSDGGVFPQTFSVSSSLLVDFDLSGFRLYFHDSSSIVATITLPSSKFSLCMHDNFLDLVASTDGLNLASSFWAKSIHDFICGPKLPNLSPLLNIRLRKGYFGLLSDELEVSIGIQHMCCVLPPDFLAFVIGYFSLPDWTSGAVMHYVSDKEEYTNRKGRVSVVYKVEVLDSRLICPVDGADNQFINSEIKQFYFGFIERCDSSDIFADIPSSCMIPEHKVSTRYRCLNFFGNDLSLQLLFNNGKCGSFTDVSSSKMRKTSLIPTCSADVWVRIPCESDLSSTFSGSTCIMSSISSCQMIVDDGYCSDGFHCLLQLIDQFSSVDDESKCYESDVLAFLQRMRSLKCEKPPMANNSAVTSTKVRLSVDLLSIQAIKYGKELAILEPIAKADTKFVYSASLENDVLMCMDISFSRVSLLSMLSKALLAQCGDSGSTSSVLSISLKKIDQYEIQIQLYLPSIDIWFYYCDWIKLIHLLDGYERNTFETVWLDSSISGDTLDQVNVVKCTDSQSVVKGPGSSSNPVSKNTNHGNSNVILRSGTIGFAVHCPLNAVEVSPQLYTDVHFNGLKNESSPAFKRELSKYLTIAARTRSCEVSINHENVRFKCPFDTIAGTLTPSGNTSIKSWSVFHIYQVNLVGEMCSISEQQKRVCLKVDCDRADVRVSSKIFVLWNEMRAGIPKSASAQYNYGHIEVDIRLRKISLLLSDERWNCSGPLFEICLRNMLLHANTTEDSLESSVTCELEMTYNNIQKVLWESFIEPWKFQMMLSQKLGLNGLISSSASTELYLTSMEQINFNITEPLLETIFRALDMVKDGWALMNTDHLETGHYVNSQLLESVSEGRYAPYVLRNLTSLPLVYHVHQCSVHADLVDLSEIKDSKIVSPGVSVPIYLNDTQEEQLFLLQPSLSRDKLTDDQRNGVAHHFMTIKLDGTSTSSLPLSMDLVGVTCFEVDLSTASNNYTGGINDESKGCVVPVVFDVSTERYSKLIRLYSTVVFLNACSVPLELRFDIPFGIAPKILDPVYPGQEVPLPLHLAEAGRMRWRPLGNCYLWSEAHNMSDILVQESKIGFSRSFVCYPSHPSSDPFRCCISVQRAYLPAAGTSVRAMIDCSNNRFLHQVTLGTPFTVNNYLPETVSLTVESGGVTQDVVLSEVVTFFHHIDHSHDLILVFNIAGFRSSTLKFPRTEAFSPMDKFSSTKFSQSETLTFDNDTGHGAINVMVEKTVDAFSGAREVSISVPFLLYNCTNFPLIVSDCINEMKGTVCTVPSYYDQFDQEPLQSRTDGLGLLISEQMSSCASLETDSSNYSSPKDSKVSSIVSSRKVASPCLGSLPMDPLSSCGSNHQEYPRTSDNSLNSKFFLSAQSVLRDGCIGDKGCGKVKAFIFSPPLISTGSETMVCMSRCAAGFTSENVPQSSWSWSLPFPLVPPGGSINVLLPHLRSSSASIISVTSTALGGPLAGRTRAITFQPRYVISNACSKDLLYRQKGTNISFHLGMGQHCQLQWTDTTRDLLVSLCFEEPGWQWSGSFLPDQLGDTLMKMRNCLSSASNMLRVEVQNSHLLVKDDKNAGSLQENSGTNLIILSDDHSGYMPYRIDNFSKEKLRIYQQKCESLDTIIYPYTSRSYAWDEPSYPHRLTVEVPGERILGSYALDDLKDFIPVYLQSTNEKPERTILLSIRAEGAKKVLSIIDSSYHIWNDTKDRNANRSQAKDRHKQNCDASVHYTDRFSVSLPSIGFSFIDSSPQELIFACGKHFTLYLHQNVEQQKLCFQMSSLQIDNQLSDTHYPVLLSFTCSSRNNPVVQIMTDDKAMYKSRRPAQLAPDISNEPVFYLAVSKWRKKDDALISFEYISFRIADFCLQLEQEAILGLLYLFKPVFQNLENLVSPKSGMTNADAVHGQPPGHMRTKEVLLHGFDPPFFNKTDGSTVSLPSVVPIGAPWQRIHLLARRQRKIYVEFLDFAPITFTLSFSSSPWMLKNGILTSGESLIHRSFMAFANVEGAQIYLKQLTIAHQMGSWGSIQEILIRHYVRQFLHESYKVFGSAGVIGNPMGFARSLAAGIRDFLSAPAKNIFQSPTGIITGIGKGTTSLVTSTVYAVSDAATQFSKAAHKGIVAFTFDDLATARMERQQKGKATQSKGVINEVFEGLTGLLQSPIKEAEKHGLPGILSGVALGVTGLVAKPAASILEATGRTAQSIRNRSKLYHLGSYHYRLRLPRPLSRERPLRPYSWEEAVGASVLKEGDGFKDEVFVMCKSLKHPGKFVVLTERIILVVGCSSLVDLGKPEFQGISLDPRWTVETEISLQSIIHMDIDNEMVHIVGSSSDPLGRKKQHIMRKGSATRKQWDNSSTPLPISQTNLELRSVNDAQEFSLVVASKLEQGKERGSGSGLMLHKRTIR